MRKIYETLYVYEFPTSTRRQDFPRVLVAGAISTNQMQSNIVYPLPTPYNYMQYGSFRIGYVLY